MWVDLSLTAVQVPFSEFDGNSKVHFIYFLAMLTASCQLVNEVCHKGHWIVMSCQYSCVFPSKLHETISFMWLWGKTIFMVSFAWICAQVCLQSSGNFLAHVQVHSLLESWSLAAFVRFRYWLLRFDSNCSYMLSCVWGPYVRFDHICVS